MARNFVKKLQTETLKKIVWGVTGQGTLGKEKRPRNVSRKGKKVNNFLKNCEKQKS